MAEFLDTSGISFAIENIIKNARNGELVLISPYLSLSKTLFERLKDTERNNVKIILIYGKDELKPDERNQLRQLKNLSLRFFENLHAKCYYNHDSMVITSMNMIEFSEKNNREMGVLIRKEDVNDSKVFSDAKREAESILAHSRPDERENVLVETLKRAAKSIVDSATNDDSRTPSRTRTTSRTKQNGFCIRCRAPIPYDLDAPYCPDCYKVWAEWKNPDYVESCCHTCGKPASTSRARPECNSCYKPRG